MIRFAIIAMLAVSGCKSSTFSVSKPGVSREQRDSDIQQCEERARGFVRNRPGTARDHQQTYNRLVVDCLVDRGYEMTGE